MRWTYSYVAILAAAACSVVVDFDGFAGPESATDGGETCDASTPPRQMCGSECVDTQNDPKHCGGCGAEHDCHDEPCTLGKCGTLLWDTPGGGGCHRVTIDANGEFAYVVRLESEADAGGLAGGLYRVRLSSGVAESATTVDRPGAIALSLTGDVVYWTTIGVPKGVWATNIVGFPDPVTTQLVPATTSNPFSVAGSASTVYWSDRGNDQVMAYDLTAKNSKPLADIVKPNDLVLDGDWLYVAASVDLTTPDASVPTTGSVQRVHMTNGAVELIDDVAPGAHDIATAVIDGVRRVYWTEYKTAKLAEQLTSTSWTTSPLGESVATQHGEDIVVDATDVYWSMRQYPFNTQGPGPVYRHKADGSGTRTNLGEFQDPKGLARFGEYLYICTNAGLERIPVGP